MSEFGHELRRRRLERNLSLSDLSALSHYSKSHLCKIENGDKRPGRELARRLDQALDARGSLARLHSGGASPNVPEDPDAWPVGLPQGDAAGAGHSAIPTDGAFGAYVTLLRDLRVLGQRTRPVEVLTIGEPFVEALCGLAHRCDPKDRVTALRLASRFAEFLGWMAQENTDENKAAWWIRRAMALAGRTGDPTMTGYGHIRMAELAIYRDDAVGVLRSARQALTDAADDLIRTAAYQRIAQGHAIRNDERQCRLALDQSDSEEHGSRTEPASGLPPLGGLTMPDPAAFVRGWCMLDLARPYEAIAALEPQFSGIPVDAVRVRARCGARLALALASAGELDRACEVAEPAIDATVTVDSATARSDLRSLSRELRRLGDDPRARRLRPLLAVALHREPVLRVPA